jgi:hypothetical protein
MRTFFWHRSDPAQFASQRECVQDVQYAFFVVRVPAKGSVRIACLTVTSCLFLVYFIFATHEIRSLYRLYHKESAQKMKESNITLPNTSSFDLSQHVKIEPVHPRPSNQRRRWKVDPFLGAIALSYATATGYFMGSTDALVYRNPAVDTESQQWGFGQVFPVHSLLSFVV